MQRLPTCLAVALVALLCASPLAAQSGGPTVRVLPVGGPGGWDYLSTDPAQHRLYIARGDRVQVFDTQSETVIGEVPGTPGVHGVALATDAPLGYASNGRADSVTVFDTRTLKVLGEIAGTGAVPDAIVLDAASRQLYTFNGRGADATVIDVGTRRIVATIPLGGKPEFAVADHQGHVFVNIEDLAQLVRIDTATNRVSARWPLDGCEEPTGLDMDRAHARLFAVCGGNAQLVVVDAGSGRQVARLPIGRGTDAVAWDAPAALVLASNGEGTLSVVRQRDADHYEALPAITTRQGARTMALDEKTQRVWLVTAAFGAVPAAAASGARPRATMIPDSFSVIVVDLAGMR